MLNWLTGAALTIADTPLTRAEVLGFATGVLNVWLLVRQKAWNWPVGIANVLVLLVVFWSAGLYADAGLQIVYVGLGLYGWWRWIAGGDQGDVLTVSHTSAAQWRVLAVAGLLGTAALWLVLDRVTDSQVPLADAVTTVLSLVATYLQCVKKLESWWVWIIADLIYIPLYLYKDLWLTALLYLIFMALCVAGLAAWRRDLLLRHDDAVPVPA